MCNDAPEVLLDTVSKASSGHQRSQPMKVRPDLPGVGVDLGKYTLLGQTHIPVDHFLDDAVLRALLARDRSFLIFGQVAGISPHIAAARTLRRRIGPAGDQYESIHHYRQKVYLRRLIQAAHLLGLGGHWPPAEEMSGLMKNIIEFSGWYDINKQGYVNGFPSELKEDILGVHAIEMGGVQIGYGFNLDFTEGVTGDMEFTF
jgi:hypothetical protein